jgi:hypothetical protein
MAGVKALAKVALISESDPGLEATRQHLRESATLQIHEFLTLDETRRKLGAFNFEIILLRLSNFKSSHVQMLAKVRAHFPKVGLVSLAHEIDPMARFQARNIPGHKLIQEEHELSDLRNVIDKLRRGEVSALRQHARAQRQGEAEILDGHGKVIRAKFVDFAQMGARLVLRSREILQKDMRIQLHYQSSTQPGRIHRIEAVVIWNEMSRGVVDAIVSGPMQTVGLRFIGLL